jgi:hypothetical protein
MKKIKIGIIICNRYKICTEKNATGKLPIVKGHSQYIKKWNSKSLLSLHVEVPREGILSMLSEKSTRLNYD